MLCHTGKGLLRERKRRKGRWMKKMGGGEEDGEGTGDRGGRDYSTISKRNLSKIPPLEDPLDPKFWYKCLCIVASSLKHPAAAHRVTGLSFLACLFGFCGAEMAAGALCVLGKDPATELHAQPPNTSILFSLPSISSSIQVRSNITCTFFKMPHG